jgi:hypothetical protein
MATEKYEFGNVSIGTTGWNAILDANVTKTEAHLHSRLLLTAGEDISEWEAVCIGPDGDVILAQAGPTSSRKPAIGLAIEDVLEDNTFRVQRVGEVENTSWSWSNIGKPVYLSTTQGELTQTKPDADIQVIGIATAATKILLLGNVAIIGEITPSTTTTTTSTTTTSTSTTTTTV